MNEEINPSQKPGGNGSSGLKILWLFLAFIPSLVTILGFETRTPREGFGMFALILGITCSLLAGIGLLNGMKDRVVRVVLGIALGGVFFLLNFIIVLFVGCSQMKF